MERKNTDEWFIEKIRAAHRKRAEYIYFIYKQLCNEFGQSKSEAVLRAALNEAGRYYGKQMNSINTPADFISALEGGNPDEVFERKSLEKSDKKGVFTVSFCPLVDAWQKMGLEPGEVAKLCDIAMETDHGIVQANEMKLSVEKCLIRGDAVCEMQVTP